MELVIYILIVYGITNIIVNEYILEFFVNKIKEINNFMFNLFSCPTCLSFYTSLLLYPLINIIITDIYFIDIFLMGLVSSGSINLIEHIKIRFS